MSVIDKKGKIFGKLNIIDLLVLILVIAAVVILGGKLTSHTADGAEGQGQQVVYTVLVRNVAPEVYESVQAMLPSQLYAEDALQNGYVTKVEATPTETDLYGTTEISRGLPGNYDLVFTIEATVEDNMSSKLGSQEIRVGKYHIVKTTEFELDYGTILSCERLDSAEAAS